MSHVKLSVLDETGLCVLRRCDMTIPPEEWLGLEYVEWKSSGDTRFAPIASATGELECSGFWDHGRADKDALWTRNAPKAPTLVEWVTRVGANFGRCRVIELQPQSYEQALAQLHRDDNNRINPDGHGWVVRTFLQLTDDPDAFMVLRSDLDDPSTEVRVALPAGTQLIVDSERLWHAVCHPGPDPRYALITSFESGVTLDRWMATQRP